MKKISLSEQVYETIKGKVISNEFAPGELLQERLLAEMLQVSRTPVREAVIRLAQEGWLDISSQKSIRVREVTLQKVIELFEVRSIVEEFALKQIFDRNLNRRLAGELDTAVQRMRENLLCAQEFARNDFQFHALFVAILGNSTLDALWKRIDEEIVRIGIMGTKHSISALESVVCDHEKIVDSLWKGEMEKVGKHLEQIREETFLGVAKTLQQN